MIVDVSRIAVGGVPYIDIDGIDYAISSDGCVIEKVADMGITNVVGKPAPRVVERTSHYIVNVSMLENTLEMLQLAWNLPSAISYGASHDYLYLGISSAPATHTLAVRGWSGLGGDQSKRRWREWYFRKVISFEPQPQDLGVGNTVFIPVRFYCYADSTQASGEEFGYVQQEKINLVINPGMEQDSDWVNFGVPPTNERSSTQVHSGVYSRHVVTDGHNVGIMGGTAYTTTTGRQYQVSGWLYLVSLTATNVLISFRHGDGVTYTTAGVTTTIGSWTRISKIITENNGGASGLILIPQNGAGAAEYYVDDIRVVEI